MLGDTHLMAWRSPEPPDHAGSTLINSAGLPLTLPVVPLSSSSLRLIGETVISGCPLQEVRFPPKNRVSLLPTISAATVKLFEPQFSVSGSRSITFPPP